MEIKAFFLGSLMITILISYANPSLATKNDDEPLINPATDLDTVFAKSPISNEYNEDVLNKESSEHLDYVLNCAKKTGHKCNDEVIEEILQNKHVSKNCCQKIVRVGKDCHVGIANLMFKSYQAKRFAYKSLYKANKVWNRCYAQIVTPAPFSG